MSDNTLSDQLTNDMKTAMKAKDKTSLNTIRNLKSAIKNEAILKGGADTVLNDEEIITVIRKQVKQRQDSIQQYNDNRRPELAQTELEEVEVLEKYLPTPLTEEEISALVADAISETGATSKADMGKVMGLMQKKAEGKADGKTISQAVIKALS